MAPRYAPNALQLPVRTVPIQPPPPKYRMIPRRELDDKHDQDQMPRRIASASNPQSENPGGSKSKTEKVFDGIYVHSSKVQDGMDEVGQNTLYHSGTHDSLGRDFHKAVSHINPPHESSRASMKSKEIKQDPKESGKLSYESANKSKESKSLLMNVNVQVTRARITKDDYLEEAFLKEAFLKAVSNCASTDQPRILLSPVVMDREDSKSLRSNKVSFESSDPELQLHNPNMSNPQPARPNLNRRSNPWGLPRDVALIFNKRHWEQRDRERNIDPAIGHRRILNLVATSLRLERRQAINNHPFEYQPATNKFEDFVNPFFLPQTPSESWVLPLIGNKNSEKEPEIHGSQLLAGHSNTADKINQDRGFASIEALGNRRTRQQIRTAQSKGVSKPYLSDENIEPRKQDSAAYQFTEPTSNKSTNHDTVSSLRITRKRKQEYTAKEFPMRIAKRRTGY